MIGKMKNAVTVIEYLLAIAVITIMAFMALPTASWLY